MNKFAKLFAYIQLGLGVVSAVRGVEQHIPEPGTGAAKLNTVINIVTATANETPEIVDNITAKNVTGFATALTNATVLVLNTAGVFRKPSVPGA